MRVVLATILATLLLTPAPALAYRDKGHDPDDRPALGFDPDIRATVRSVWLTEHAGRQLRVKFRAYERLGVWWFVNVRLDSRGGPQVDYVIFLSDQDLGGSGCAIRRGLPGPPVEGSFSQERDRASCRVPARLVRPTKKIRWKLVSPSGYDGTSDAAPNGSRWFT